ncbi:MAG: outer membrane lipoprotein-sorting protein [Deltaproteobacteria bacterium]|nr:outer membrane lipoprotein-sorting protein [Deltaproteobacteria bacterium]
MPRTLRHCTASALAALALLLFVDRPRAAAAEELSATTIVDRALANNAFGFQNAVAQVTLRLTAKDKSERVRQIEIRSRTAGKLTKTVVRFQSPADVAGTAFLILQNEGRDDDQYLYLPALAKTKRITATQRNQKFMGTDFTYADLESRDLRRASLTRRADAKVGADAVFVIEAIPKDPKESDYGKTVSFIHQTAFVPLKVEFYDKGQKLLKVLEVARLELREGRHVVIESTVTNEQAGTRTRTQVGAIDFKAGLSDAEFTERALSGG